MSSNNTKQSSLNDFDQFDDEQNLENEWTVVDTKKKNKMNKPVANTNTSTSSGLQRQRNGANNFSKNYSSVGNYQNRRPYESNHTSTTSSRSNGFKNSNEFSTPKPTSTFAQNKTNSIEDENLGHTIELTSNFFEINAKPFKVYQYDARITEITGSGKIENVKISKEIFIRIEKKQCESVKKPAGSFLFSDFARQLYSAVLLSLIDFEIFVDKKVFKINLDIVGEINYDPNDASIGQEVLNVFNLLYTQKLQLSTHRVKRRLFFTNNKAKKLDFGIEIWKGIFVSVRQNVGGLNLNIDVCNMVFHTSQSLLDFLMHFYRCKSVKNLNEKLKENNGRQFLDEYRGLQVLDIHGYLKKVLNFSANSYENKFKLAEQNDRMIDINDYFRQFYETKLEFPELPCVNVGKERHIPIELLTINIQPKNKLTSQKELLVKESSCDALTRRSDIMNLMSNFAFNSNPLLAEFKIQTSSQPIEVEGRVIKAPDLKYGGNGFVSSENIANKGSWNGSRLKFVEPSPIEQWVALASPNCKIPIQEFCDQLTETARNQGMNMKSVSDIIENLPNFSNIKDDQVPKLVNQIKDIINKLKKNYKKLSLIFLFIRDKNQIMYSIFKTIGDIEFGIATQFVLYNENEHEKFMKKPYNILLKLNGKLGGRNFLLSEENATYCEYLRNLYDDGLMIIGADVTHPKPGDFDDETGKAESIAAITGSLDSECTYYVARLYTQRSNSKRVEMIVDLHKALASLLEEYYSYENRNSYPKRIIYLRDGVSDGEFNQVLEFELKKIRQVCSEVCNGFNPTVTFAVVQKRHHARFFVKNSQDANGKYKNIPPGTTVDEKIVSTGNQNNYQCAHACIKGTSRPCHYTLLHDENNMDQDKMNVLSDYLCHIYARSERSVSYPAPTYCAHLAAFRARSYIRKPLRLNLNSDEIQSEEIKLHQNVKDTMFYL